VVEGSIFVMRGKCSDVNFQGIIFVIVQVFIFLVGEVDIIVLRVAQFCFYYFLSISASKM
jgi:hypothetical protein